MVNDMCHMSPEYQISPLVGFSISKLVYIYIYIYF